MPCRGVWSFRPWWPDRAIAHHELFSRRAPGLVRPQGQREAEEKGGRAEMTDSGCGANSLSRETVNTLLSRREKIKGA